MGDFTITERTEPFTFAEVFDFIDDTNISKNDACELKSRIVDAVQGIREKVIDEFLELAFEVFKSDSIGYAQLLTIAEQMKGGGNDVETN